MKKFTIALLTICLGIFASEGVFASHMTGANITYTAVPGAPNQFVITVKLYRDCFGIPYEDPITINWQSPSGCGPTGSASLGLVPGTGVGNEIQTSNYPPCAISTCNGGTAYGIQEWVYTGLIDLGAACSDWVISYTSCCRNAALNTAVPNNMYVETTLDNLNFHFDDSPVFNRPPVATFCIGRSYQFDMSCTDPNGDSLVYILADAWDGPGAPVTYNPPYSGSYPIASVPAPTIDPHTGIITFYPTTVQVGVLAILVESYDRTTGQLIGTIRRDMQVNVEAVCNDPPRLDSIQVHMQVATVPCGDSVLHCKLTWEMRCNTLAADGSDFRLLSPSNIPVLIQGAVAHNCNALGLSDSLTLYLRVPLCENGTYKLLSKIGYDGNTLLNGCGIALPQFDTLRFQFTNCYPGVPDLLNVTVDQTNESNANIIWGVPANLDTNLFDKYEIFRTDGGPTGSYQWVASTYNWTDTTFIDTVANPDQMPYSYGVKIWLKYCYGSPMSDTIQTIFLTCSPNADSLSVDFNWTGYWGWPSPTYEVWMTDGQGGPPTLFTSTPNTALNYLKQDLGHYEVRVKTVNGNFTSWSNTCSFDVLKNDPILPNVMTPNGDGLNDVFYIQNMSVYPDNKLTVFNRWGKKVYEKEGYNNDWDGSGLEDGTYYFVLKIEGRRPFDFHGTVNIYNHKQ